MNPGRHETKYFLCCWYIWQITESQTELLFDLTRKITLNRAQINSIHCFFIRSIYYNGYNETTGRKTGKFQQCALCHARSSVGRKWEVIFVYMILERGAPRQRGAAALHAAAGSLQACGREWAMTGVSDWELRGCRPSNLARLQNGIRKRHRIIAVFMDNGHLMRAFSKIFQNNWPIWADGPNKQLWGIWGISS